MRIRLLDLLTCLVIRIVFLVVFAVQLGGCEARAQTQEQERIVHLTANIRQFDSWYISMASEAQWRELRKQGAQNTAITNLNTHTTYIRTSFISSADDELLARVLLHEAGHIACRCTNEEKAETWAWQHH
jgi:hypothetical protein